MRLILDAHLSPQRIGKPLEDSGHDVFAIAADPSLDALDDPAVLELAAEERRILITRNSRDFAPLVREWAEAGRHHHGCILIWTLASNQFGPIVARVGSLLEDRPNPPDWRDLTVAL